MDYNRGRKRRGIEELVLSNNSISCIRKHKCSGCGACFNICPVGAISMEQDEEGFLCPKIDIELCTECGLCKRICPSLNPDYKNSKTPECFAAYAKDDIRTMSSSGGLFTVMSETILDKGGYVCGAAFDDNFMVNHIIVDNKQDLAKLRGSKYVQSNMGTVYKQIKDILEKDKYVLFSGCPCQIAGLKAFLCKEYGKLITIDLICHGAPSPMVWERYLKENFSDKKIKKIDFRDKAVFGWSTHMNIYFEDDSVYRETCDKDSYYKAFLPCLSLRSFCGNCHYSKLPRQGDITLADFWGIEAYKQELNDGQGTSLILLNNQKAVKLISELKDKLNVFEKIPLDFAISSPNWALTRSCPSHEARKRFFDLLKIKTVNEAIDMALNQKYDVAIVGCGFSDNYGAVLTNYAFFEYLKTLKLSPLVIDKPKTMVNCTFSDYNYSQTMARKFLDKYIETSKVYYDKKDLRELNNMCDTFIVGSDQIWNYGVYESADDFYFLDFVNDNKKKISYASSFGHFYWDGPEEKRLKTSYCLQKFDNISVREDLGVDICKKNFNVNATHVLDPVFLCPISSYDKLIANANVNKEENYIATYILDPNPNIKQALLYISNKLNLKLINMIEPQVADYAKINLDLDKTVETASLEDFLYYVKNSKFVITNSFHATCCAIIFKKPFICIANINRGLPRFLSLLKMFKLTKRMVLDPDEIKEKEYLFNPINYEEVDKIINEKREFSINWLKNAIFSPKNKPVSTYDIVDKRCDDIENYINNAIIEKNEKDEKLNNILKLIINKNQIYRKYYYYKVLSQITPGPKRNYYKIKYSRFEENIECIKNFTKYI